MTQDDINTVLNTVDLIMKTAKAIEGPHVQGDMSKEKFDQLREIRWAMLTENERRNRINQASAAAMVVLEFVR